MGRGNVLLRYAARLYLPGARDLEDIGLLYSTVIVIYYNVTLPERFPFSSMFS